jgi:hypothetical protein
MRIEHWKDVAGYEGRYQVSSAGEIRALSFKQRYLLRNGAPAFRNTKERLIATQSINSGYSIVHLNLNNKRTAHLVHRLVALAFCEGYFEEADVNHKNGCKKHNCSENLEWVTRTNNHLHAVAHGFNKQAQPMRDPDTGIRYASIAQAAKGTRKSHRTVAKNFIKEPLCLT